MNIADKLIARGYWNAAGEGGSGSGSSESKDNDNDKGSKNNGNNRSDNSDGDDGDDGDDDDGDDDSDSDSDDGDSKKSGISDSEAKLLKESMARKKQLAEMKAVNEELSKKLKTFDGVDMEQVNKLIEAQKKAETDAMVAKQDWEGLKSQMVKQHDAQVKKLKDEIANLSSKVDGSKGVIDKLTIGHSFDSSKFRSVETNLSAVKARKLYGDHFEISEGKIVSYDRPRGEEGRVPLVDAQGNNLSFEQAFSKIINADPDKDSMLKAKAKPGANSGTSGDKKKETREELKGMEKIEAELRKKAGK